MEHQPQEGASRAVFDVLQELADGLAEELQRPVAVDDPNLRLLVATAHTEEVDRARLKSLVGRRLDGPTRDYVMASGAQRWREPTRLEANAEVGFERPRWCFPLWSKYEQLGFMWLIDDGQITSQQLEIAGETAQRMEQELTRRAESNVKTDLKVEAWARALVAPDQLEREAAAASLRERGAFRYTRHLAVLVVRSVPSEAIDPARVGWTAHVVRRGISSAMQGRLKESFVYSATDRDSIVVVGFRKQPNDAELMSLATTLHVEIHRFDPTTSATITIGVGEPVIDLGVVRDAFAQGGVAAQVARDKGQVAAAWGRHPLEGLLRAWVDPDLPTALVPSALRTLDDQPEDTRQVIATFLANAGNVNATADQMHLHRTTVYYRLTKFRERTGLDLDDGQTRLLVHLWFAARDLLNRAD